AFAADGSALAWSTYFGGTASEEALAVAVNASGQVAVTGVTNSTDLPTTGAYQGSSGGFQDAFVARYSSTGSRQYSTYYGGAGTDVGRAAAVDAAGEVFFAGST